MNAKIVVGLGFGDEGKGITTDYLCSQSDPTNTIVVRYSSGQQCGHTVHVGNVKHIFSNYGSGTLRGISTYISEYCTMYPNTIWNEYYELLSKEITPTLYIHPFTKLTTPLDVAWGRLREKQLEHGSVGLGVGATMKRHEEFHKIYAQDLLYPEILNQKLVSLGNYYFKKLENYSIEDIEYFEEVAISENELWEQAISNFKWNIKDTDFLRKYENIIFEGAQGILLDMNFGIFPHVTYANTTSENAFHLLNKMIYFESIEVYYITRCYQTRHGNGWMSNQQIVELINTEHETCVFNEWQRDFRTGELDYDLINYALNTDIQNIYEPFSKNLVVTCLDQRPDFTFDKSKINFEFDKIYGSYGPDSSKFKLL